MDDQYKIPYLNAVIRTFGDRFYLTTIREQAERMAKRKQQALGAKPLYKNMNSMRVPYIKVI